MKTDWKALYRKAMRDRLTSLGCEVCANCLFQDRTYKHRTYNLHDSYGWVVYWREGEETRAIRGSAYNDYFKSRKAKVAKKWYGEIITAGSEKSKFFQKLNKEFEKSKASFLLVVFAAMPYASILEDGGTGSVPDKKTGARRPVMRKKYKVISTAYNYLKNNRYGIDGMADII